MVVNPEREIANWCHKSICLALSLEGQAASAAEAHARFARAREITEHLVSEAREEAVAWNAARMGPVLVRRTFEWVAANVDITRRTASS